MFVEIKTRFISIASSRNKYIYRGCYHVISVSFRALTGLLVSSSLLHAQEVSGVVFRDFNGDGIRQTQEPLVPGVRVFAYDTTGAVCADAVSAGPEAPNYTLRGCGQGPLRIEFVLPDTGHCACAMQDFPSSGGAQYGSSVQFVRALSGSVNFALHHPGDYNAGLEDPMVFVPCYVGGDPLPDGSASGAADWFVGFPSLSSGINPPPLKLDGSVIGALWGVAYSRQSGGVFATALMKRQVGFGVLGSGGIYLLERGASGFLVTPFFDMDDNSFQYGGEECTRSRAPADAPVYGMGSSFLLNPGRTQAEYLGPTDTLTGAPVGLGVIGSNADRGLSVEPSDPSYDAAAFDQVGKVGLGGIAISEDGRYLFVVNVYSRRLFRLELDNPNHPTEVVSVMSAALPDISCNAGVLRPFAVACHRGKVYVGAVCTGELGVENVVDGPTDLRAYVFRIERPAEAWVFRDEPILDVPLNYRKGLGTVDAFPESDRWYTWTSDATAHLIHETIPVVRSRQTPILSDIGFSDRGDMILGFMDRFGHQAGFFNHLYLADFEEPYIVASAAGDVLIAGIDCASGQFHLEHNGLITSLNGASLGNPASNGQGPGGSEFFQGDFFANIHEEISMGSMVALRGADRILMTAIDPIAVWTGGVRPLSTTNGEAINSGYQLYESFFSANGSLGKANGLGDLDAVRERAPIEIGNRVWLDQNSNGIQDAGEPGIPDVLVRLVMRDSTIASARTDAEGLFYFGSGSGANTAFAIYGIAALQPGGEFRILVPNAVGSDAQPALSGRLLTIPNAPGAGLDDRGDTRDSDAMLLGNDAVVTVQVSDLPSDGANNHHFDIGFSPEASCLVEVRLQLPLSVCYNAPIPLDTALQVITPASLGGYWQSDGDGFFVGGNIYGSATAYMPGAADQAKGSVRLTLTTNNPTDLVPPIPCPPIRKEATVAIQRVDCGMFPWKGG
jgi:hypothetical protein